MATQNQFGSLATLAGPKPQSLLDQTMQEYPGIADALSSVAYRESPNRPGKPGIEFWQRGEEESFDPSRPAIEVFNTKTTRPMDVAGDMVSHYLAKGNDPVVTKVYRDFEQSLTPEQIHRLHEQYQHYQKEDDEKRPYDEWYRVAGLPSYFRGYLFKQWDVNPQDWYTPQQLKAFDALNQYLKTPKKKTQ